MLQGIRDLNNFPNYNNISLVNDILSSYLLYIYVGLGTSSILAGVVMASLLKAAGKSCDTTGLLHAVSGPNILYHFDFID